MRFALKLTISLLYVLNLSFLTYASDPSLEEGEKRPAPVAIKIISRKKQEIIKHEFEPFASTQADRKNCDVNHYPSNYGEGFLFEYDKEYKDNESKDKTILETLGKYRTANLDKRNPLIVRFKAYTNSIPEEIFSLFTGVFVSGDENYTIQDNMGKDVGTDDFKLEPIKQSFLYPYGKTINKIPDEVKSCREEADKELKKLAQEFLNKKNQEMKKRLMSKLPAAELDNNIPVSIIYTVPSLKIIDQEKLANNFLKEDNNEKKLFPITIYNFIKGSTYHKKEDIHFKKVVQRIFKYDLGLGNQNPSSFSTQQKFMYHLLCNREDDTKLSENLFHHKILDNSSIEGCFETGFTQNFTDSEQAFLNWIDLKENAKSCLLENISNFENISKNKPISIDKIDIEFLSYLDMCPMCRGTMSLLYTSTSGENEEWLNKKIRDIFTECIEEDKAVLSPTFSLNLKCISLQKCYKGLPQ